MSQLLNVHDYEIAAREILDANALGYFASGADGQRTLADNRRAWQDLRIRPRAFVDVESRDLSTTVLGQAVSMPMLVAPMAFQRMAHPDGELAAVRACGDLGTIYCLSTISNTPVERVVAEVSARVAAVGVLYAVPFFTRSPRLSARRLVVAPGCCQKLASRARFWWGRRVWEEKEWMLSQGALYG